MWKNGLDNFNTAKLIGLLHVLIAHIPQGFLGLGIQRAVGLGVALLGKFKQFLDARHGLAFPPIPQHPGQNIGQRDADHDNSGQMGIHCEIMNWPARAALSQIKSIR